jgi:hypothetical protein
MFEWLLNHCGRTIQEFIENPSFEDERNELIKAIEIADEEELRLGPKIPASVQVGHS